jgi:hypothetical protein
MIVEGKISKVTEFDDGNISYTFKSNDDLFRFTEPTAMSDTKGRALLRGSELQCELHPVLDDDNNPVVKPFEKDDGSTGAVGVCRLGRWYLVKAALAADDKRANAPLQPIEQPAAASAQSEEG